MTNDTREAGSGPGDVSRTPSPEDVVRRMFRAFRRGDVEGILETVHPESRWRYVGANPEPRRAELEGHAGVRRFFEAILRRLDMRVFEAREFVVEAHTVVVFGSESGFVMKSGKAFHNDWVQKYVVRDGKITEMEEFNIVAPDAPAPADAEAEAAKRVANERIDDALRMTFPASDPPAWPSGGPRPALTEDAADD